MSRFLIITGITNCKQCPFFAMENDGKVTEPICKKVGFYLPRDYAETFPKQCPLPKESFIRAPA